MAAASSSSGRAEASHPIPLRTWDSPWTAPSSGCSRRSAIDPVQGASRRARRGDGRGARRGSARAAWALLEIDAADDRVELLIDRLLRTQWPDGGWNCDSSASGRTSAFSESLLPLRALALHARLTGSGASHAAAGRAAEVFLSRRLFRRRSTGDVIAQQYVELHWPRYWRYDFLFALVVMREAGFLDDPRCADALDLLESKRLPDGGYPLEGRWDGSMSTPGKPTPVSWGRVDRRRTNEWVTVDALAVLHAAGRL